MLNACNFVKVKKNFDHQVYIVLIREEEQRENGTRNREGKEQGTEGERNKGAGALNCYISVNYNIGKMLLTFYFFS